MSKKILCHYASLNANSLKVINNRPTQPEYIRYLRLQKYDILCLQETRAKTPELIHSLNMHFQPQTSHWTKHVGIFSFSPSFQITLINTNHLITNDEFRDRIQLCQVEHPQKLYTPFFILNIYTPATTHRTRREFFDILSSMLYSMQDQLSFERLIIVGDFNYSHLRPHLLTRATSSEWIHLLGLFFFNSMMMNDLSEIITFQRTHGDSMVCSVIDYIYVGQQFRNQLKDTRITRLNSACSDHSVLQIEFYVGSSPTGPGLWRANLVYASHTMLQNRITEKIIKVLASFKRDSLQSPEDKWDQVQSATKRVIKNYSYEYVNWRNDTIKHLERKRNRI
jgi:exonuclease III